MEPIHLVPQLPLTGFETVPEKKQVPAQVELPAARVPQFAISFVHCPPEIQ